MDDTADDQNKVTYARLRWAGGEHRFEMRFSTPGLVLSDLGHSVRDLGARYTRLIAGAWSAADIIETIHAGLMGGREMGKAGHREADRLVETHVCKRPMGESLPLAQTICAVAIFGVPKAIADMVSDPEQLSEMTDGEG